MRSRSARAASCSSGPEQAADVGAPLDPGQRRRRSRASSRSSTDEPGDACLGRFAVDEVADPFDRGAQRTQPRLEVGLRGVDAQPGAQGRGEGVGEPAGLGQRDGEGSGRDAMRRGGSTGRRGVREAWRRAGPRRGWRGAPARSARPGRSPRSPRAGRGGRRRPSTAPSRAAGRRCTPAASARPEGRLVEHVELGLALVAPGAQRLEVAQGLARRRGAGRAGRARSVPWRWSSRRSRRPSVDRLGGSRRLAQGVGEPGVVALGPPAVGAHLLEDAVDEPDEVDVGPC